MRLPEEVQDYSALNHQRLELLLEEVCSTMDLLPQEEVRQRLPLLLEELEVACFQTPLQVALVLERLQRLVVLLLRLDNHLANCFPSQQRAVSDDYAANRDVKPPIGGGMFSSTTTAPTAGATAGTTTGTIGTTGNGMFTSGGATTTAGGAAGGTQPTGPKPTDKKTIEDGRST